MVLGDQTHRLVHTRLDKCSGTELNYVYVILFTEVEKQCILTMQPFLKGSVPSFVLLLPGLVDKGSLVIRKLYSDVYNKTEGGGTES